MEKEIMQGTMPGARRRGRPRTAWMDNIKNILKKYVLGCHLSVNRIIHPTKVAAKKSIFD